MNSADRWKLWGGLTLLALTAVSASAEESGIGTVKTVTGTVQVLRGGRSMQAAPGFVLQTTDVVQTGKASTAGIVLRDKTMLSAGSSSVLRLDQFSFDDKTQQGKLQATLQKGRLAVISGAIAKHSPETVQFRTSTMTLGVRGTEFIIDAQDRGE